VLLSEPEFRRAAQCEPGPMAWSEVLENTTLAEGEGVRFIPFSELLG
jgi:hypothetical protein